MSKSKAEALFEHALECGANGNFEEAVEYFENTLREDPEKHVAVYNLACCYSILGESEKALTHLERAINSDGNCLVWALTDTELDPVREDPRFERLFVKDGTLNKSTDEEDDSAKEATVKNSTQTEEKPKEPKKKPLPFALILTLGGILITITLASSPVAIVLGLPLTFSGMYLYWRQLDREAKKAVERVRALKQKQKQKQKQMKSVAVSPIEAIPTGPETAILPDDQLSDVDETLQEAERSHATTGEPEPAPEEPTEATPSQAEKQQVSEKS